MSNHGVVPGIGKNQGPEAWLVGVLANRPAPSGSNRAYFATDDAYGTLYYDILSGGIPVWTPVAPRGLLASSQITSPPAAPNASGGIVVANAVSGFSCTANLSNRPIKVSLLVQMYTSATAPARLLAGVFYYPTAAGSGTVVIALDLNEGSAGTTATLATTLSGSNIIAPSGTPETFTPGTNYTFAVAAQAAATGVFVAAPGNPLTLLIEEV